MGWRGVNARGYGRVLRSLTFANVAAALALLLAAAALVLSLGAGNEVATRGESKSAERAGTAERAARAETAGSAETAERARFARTADNARRAAVADRLRGVAGRRLADAARRAGGVRRPEHVKLETGRSATALTAGPFRVRVACGEAPQGGPQVRLTFSSTHEGSLASIAGTPGVPLDEGGSTLLELRGEKALWSGGRSFSLASPKGSVVEGVLSYGINQLGSDCVASVAGLS